MAVHLAIADDMFDGVFFVLSWMRSGTELSQFLGIFLLTL